MAAISQVISGWRMPLWLAAAAGGWLAGRYGLPGNRDGSPAPGPVARPAAAVVGSSPSPQFMPRPGMRPEIVSWMQQVKAAEAASFPDLFAAMRSLYPPGAERREAAEFFLLSEWMGRDLDAALLFCEGLKATEPALLENAVLIMVRAWPEKAGALLFSAQADLLPEALKNSALLDLAREYPAMFLRLDPTDLSGRWNVAFESLVNQDASAGVRQLADYPPPGDQRLNCISVAATAWAAQDAAAAQQWATTLTDPSERRTAVNAWLNALADLNPGEALRRLRDCMELTTIGGLSGRDPRLSIVEALARTDLAAALAAVPHLCAIPGENGDLLDAADVRERMLASRAATLPQEPVALMAELERIAAMVDPGYDGTRFSEEMAGFLYEAQSSLTTLSGEDSLEAARLYLRHHRRPEENPFLSFLLSQAAVSLPDQAVAMVRTLDEGSRAFAAAELIESLSLHPARKALTSEVLGWVAPEAWSRDLVVRLRDHLADYAPVVASLPADSGAQARVETARFWAGLDPQAAAAWADGLPDEQKSPVLRALTEIWAGYDELGAGEWMAEIPGGEAKDSAIAGLVDAVATDNPQYAWQWTEQIAGNDARRDALTEIASRWKNPSAEFLETLQAAGLSPGPNEAQPKSP